jgi:hypothetical protein
MNTDECFKSLEKAGWFNGWSASAIKSAKASIEENEQIRSKVTFPGAALISVWGDSECIYEEDSYTEILNEFKSGSHGFFKPKNIEEVWTDEEDGEFSIEISFEVQGKVYSSPMEYSGDWLDPTIFELINEAMADLDIPMIFVMPDIGFGQDYGFLLMPLNLVASAVENKLLPPLENSDFDEFDEEVGDEDFAFLDEDDEEDEDEDFGEGLEDEEFEDEDEEDFTDDDEFADDEDFDDEEDGDKDDYDDDEDDDK